LVPNTRYPIPSSKLLQLEAIQIHHLVPGGDEVVHKLLGSILASVYFGDGAQLGVRPEDQVNAGSGPFGLA